MMPHESRISDLTQLQFAQQSHMAPFPTTQGMGRSSTKQLMNSQSPQNYKSAHKYEKATRAIMIAEREIKINHRRITSKDLLNSNKKGKTHKEAGLGTKSKMLGFAAAIVNS